MIEVQILSRAAGRTPGLLIPYPGKSFYHLR